MTEIRECLICECLYNPVTEPQDRCMDCFIAHEECLNDLRREDGKFWQHPHPMCMAKYLYQMFGTVKQPRIKSLEDQPESKAVS